MTGLPQTWTKSWVSWGPGQWPRPSMSDQTVNLPIGLTNWGMGLVTSLTSLGATLTTWDRDSIGVSLITCASSKLERKNILLCIAEEFPWPSFALQPVWADGKHKPWGAPRHPGRGAQQVICWYYSLILSNDIILWYHQIALLDEKNVKSNWGYVETLVDCWLLW